MSQDLKDSLAIYFANPRKNIPIFAKTMVGTQPSSWALRANYQANQARAWHEEQRLGDIRAQTLIIVGKQDWVCPAFLAEDMHRGIPGSKLLEIANSGHFSWIEQPAQFFSALNGFLGGK